MRGGSARQGHIPSRLELVGGDLLWMTAHKWVALNPHQDPGASTPFQVLWLLICWAWPSLHRHHWKHSCKQYPSLNTPPQGISPAAGAPKHPATGATILHAEARASGVLSAAASLLGPGAGLRSFWLLARGADSAGCVFPIICCCECHCLMRLAVPDALYVSCTT